ncbi:hypothetical protein DEU56DRAFT_512743 [Suillus clintonianus]|uniref:uncharacterized protein n=1 Tax=Suillus clintonianus TaxID=1904413 RepID=UPI001B87E2FB|nr:uncharacterized protein DEU56DRAFT_512743 [Suillus clintonianus]KAG2152724.1 hypothetical protein DEU56DRAFT_512743 [Suillus clintonianus]
MPYNWRESELYKHVEAAQAGQAQATTDDGQPTSQPQQNDLPSALVDSYDNSVSADTQHQITDWGHSISNDQALSSAGQRGPGLSQIDLPKVHSAVGQPLHNSCPSDPHHAPSYYPSANDASFSGTTPQSQSRCLWDRGQCSFTADTVKSVIEHIASDHLPKHVLPARKVKSDHPPRHVLPVRRVKCQVCSPPKTFRRDTILRHIREVHYGDSRCKHSLDDSAL